MQQTYQAFWSHVLSKVEIKFEDAITIAQVINKAPTNAKILCLNYQFTIHGDQLQ
jgi:hypothetical protein